MPPVLALFLTLISSNYPCLEHLFMVPKVFEPFKFGCNIKAPANNAYICQNVADGMKKVETLIRLIFRRSLI